MLLWWGFTAGFLTVELEKLWCTCVFPDYLTVSGNDCVRDLYCVLIYISVHEFSLMGLVLLGVCYWWERKLVMCVTLFYLLHARKDTDAAHVLFAMFRRRPCWSAALLWPWMELYWVSLTFSCMHAKLLWKSFTCLLYVSLLFLHSNFFCSLSLMLISRAEPSVTFVFP